MAKADQARHEEIKMYIPPKEETKKFKYPNAPKRPPLPFSWLCSEYRPKIKEHPGLFTAEAAKKLGDMRTNTAADDKQPCEKKTAQLEEKQEKSTAACQARGEPDAARGSTFTKFGTIRKISMSLHKDDMQVRVASIFLQIIR